MFGPVPGLIADKDVKKRRSVNILVSWGPVDGLPQGCSVQWPQHATLCNKIYGIQCCLSAGVSQKLPQVQRVEAFLSPFQSNIEGAQDTTGMWQRYLTLFLLPSPATKANSVLKGYCSRKKVTENMRTGQSFSKRVKATFRILSIEGRKIGKNVDNSYSVATPQCNMICALCNKRFCFVIRYSEVILCGYGMLRTEHTCRVTCKICTTFQRSRVI